MLTGLMIFHAIVSVLLIVTVLLQFGKGAEAGLMSGGGASDAVFSGSQKGNIFTKITAVLATIFVINSIFLAKIQGSRSSESILDDEAPIARPLNSDTTGTSTEKKASPSAATPKADKTTK